MQWLIEGNRSSNDEVNESWFSQTTNTVLGWIAKKIFL
jgi:hypothetical protein